MKYIIGEIHGNYKLYKQMLSLIGFSDADELYPVGDMIDRGDMGVEVLYDMSMRYNVFPVLGNHEYAAAQVLLEQKRDPQPAIKKWYELGGEVTHRGFMKLDPELREGLVEYLADLPLYEEVMIGDIKYVLTHSAQTALPEEFQDHVRIYGKTAGCKGDCTKIGNTRIKEGGRMSNDRKNIEIASGRGLCALCLDNGREFYVF